MFVLILLTVLCIALLITSFIWAFGLLSMFVGNIRTGVPFIPISKDVLPEIHRVLDLQNNSTFYDLGAGEGRVCRMIASEVPGASITGIELTFVPYTLARIRNTFRPIKNMRIIKADLFTTPISDATHVFVYLFPKVVAKLLPKLEQELRPGTRVISCDFPFTHKVPSEVIQTTTKKKHTLYVYVF